MRVAYLSARQRAMACTALLIFTSGCGSSGAGEAQRVCARLFSFETRTYTNLAAPELSVGEEIGSATFKKCDDTGGSPGSDSTDAEQVKVFQIEGLAVSDAVAAGASASDADLFAVVNRSGEPSDAVKRYIDTSP